MIFDGIVFDFDGVIVDSEHIALGLDRTLLATYGVDLSADTLAELFVGATEEHHDRELQRLAGGRITDGDRDRYDQEFARQFLLVAPIPGVERMLQKVTLPKAIASNNRHEWIRATLRRLSLDAHFGEHITARDDVAEGKPSPDVYLRAAEKLGFSATCCAAVEDSGPGIRAARAAGMTVFGYVNRHMSADDVVALGGIPFERMGDLPDRIAAL